MCERGGGGGGERRKREQEEKGCEERNGEID